MPVSSRKSADAARFGAVIKRLRMEQGWTLAKLSQRSGMNPTYLGVLEKGGNLPSIPTLFELAEVFNTSAADIVREVEEMRRQARSARVRNLTGT
jgi:transcriptional regulator with XRE-family HTH domain